MDFWTALGIFSRWVHISTACVVFGCTFFLRILLPIALKGVDPETRKGISLRARRAYKFVVHPGILLFLLSGTYNAIRAWPTYNRWPGVTHGIFGIHLLLALVVFAIALWLLAGSEPRASYLKWSRLNLVLLFLIVAAGATLKWARETAHDKGMVPVQIPIVAHNP